MNLSPPMPCDLDAEACLLGSMMSQSVSGLGCNDEIVTLVSAADFTDESYRTIFTVLADLHAANLPLDDAAILQNRLAGRLAQPSYELAKLLDRVGSPAYGLHYASIVRTKSLERSFLKAIWELQEQSSSPAFDVRTAASAAAQCGPLSSTAGLFLWSGRGRT